MGWGAHVVHPRPGPAPRPPLALPGGASSHPGVMSTAALTLPLFSLLGPQFTGEESGNQELHEEQGVTPKPRLRVPGHG